MASRLMKPTWQQEFYNFKGIKSTYIIEGNINDFYPVEVGKNELDEPCYNFVGLNKTLGNIFEADHENGDYDFIFCNPIFGFYDPLNSNRVGEIVRDCEQQIREREKELKGSNPTDKNATYTDNKMLHMSEVIREALTQTRENKEENAPKKGTAVVVDFASRFIPSPDSLSPDETAFFANLLYASMNAKRPGKYINTLILVVDKYNDIPAWFSINNPNVRNITITNPNRAERITFIEKYFPMLNTEENKVLKNRFVDMTSGMRLTEIRELRRLVQYMETPVDQLQDAVSVYKYGFKDNPWLSVKDKLGNDFEKRLEERVIGQPEATKKMVRLLKRAVMGMSGLQHSSGANKPRGILFMAGPTGTGKTEMAKAVTELLFEDERALVRFDMSEYALENSDQKLFGAPPGYVGYDHGGQLTNAVKANPFCVLLFDEIEKAHPSIMDKFLQILEDGRMTDGQGNTVYFSETFILFTSNVGISKEVVDPVTGKVIGRENIIHPDEAYDIKKQKVEEAMRVYFKPEVMNRIGENVVVFDFISKEASDQIVSAKMKKMNDNIRKEKHVSVKLSENVINYFEQMSMKEDVRANGGRGIINILEEYYLNPLAEFMYDENVSEGNMIQIDVVDEKLVFVKG